MNNLIENDTIKEVAIEENILENLKEASRLSIKIMAENALKGPNMATRKSLEEAVKFEEKLKTNDKNRGDIEYE